MSAVHTSGFCGLRRRNASRLKWRIVFIVVSGTIPALGILPALQGAGMLGKFCLVLGMMLAFTRTGAAQYNQGDVELGFTLYNANCITCHGPNGDSIPGINLRT